MNIKVWLIKHQRALTGTSLGDAKAAVEGAVERLTTTATRDDKRRCILDYFRTINGPPTYITALLEHRVSWYRWAGLELLDSRSWDESERGCERVPELVADRSVIVRMRAANDPRLRALTMRVIEQLVHHFWARGALTREEALYLVKHGFARESDLPGLTEPGQPIDPATYDPPSADPEEDYYRDRDEREVADLKARAAEKLEDELVGRNAGSRKAGGKKKKPTGHNLAPACETIAAHVAAREPYPALCELGNRLMPCATWRDAAKAIGAAKPESLETALVGLLAARPRALGELWFWFDLEPLYEWADDKENAGPVADSLAKLLAEDNLSQVGRLGQLLKAAEVQMLLDLLPARRAFLNLLPVLYHAHFPKLGLWLVPPTGAAVACWPALPWSFVLVYNARQGTADQPPQGYLVNPESLPYRVLRTALTTALAMAPVAIRELLIHRLREQAVPVPDQAHYEKYIVFERDLYCPFTWRV